MDKIILLFILIATLNSYADESKNTLECNYDFFVNKKGVGTSVYPGVSKDKRHIIPIKTKTEVIKRNSLQLCKQCLAHINQEENHKFLENKISVFEDGKTYKIKKEDLSSTKIQMSILVADKKSPILLAPGLVSCQDILSNSSYNKFPLQAETESKNNFSKKWTEFWDSVDANFENFISGVLDNEEQISERNQESSKINANEKIDQNSNKVNSK